LSKDLEVFYIPVVTRVGAVLFIAPIRRPLTQFALPYLLCPADIKKLTIPVIASGLFALY
jgi:hypothetical protein